MDVFHRSPVVLPPRAVARRLNDHVPRVQHPGYPCEEAEEDVDEEVAATAATDHHGDGW